MTKPEKPAGKTDWTRIRAMTDEQRLAGALADPDAQPLSDQALARARRPGPRAADRDLQRSGDDAAAGGG